MTETNHTPGPWALSEETLRDDLRSKLVHGLPEGMLAIVRVENQGAYYGDANARLIASAPDLLAALKALQIQALQSDVNDPSNEWGCEALAMARAAISKAEGRQ